MSNTLASLPDEVRQLIAPHMADAPTLDRIGVEIANKRDEAKQARTSSGVENVWIEAEEAYIGIDDANRHEYAAARWAKPMAMDGPMTTDGAPRDNYRSTLFYRMTARYTDAGAAKLQEILLPPDDKAFSFKAMPVPAVIKEKDNYSQVVHSVFGVPLTRAPKPGEPAMEMPATVSDFANENIDMATKRAKAAETRVYDWMVESRFRAEFRKVIKDAAKLGTGVLKGPFPKSKRGVVVKENEDGIDIVIRDRIVPSCQRISVWNIFPDPACGEDIHEGDFIFERDHMSPRQVRGLKKLPGYIASQIDKVLKEGPEKVDVDDEEGRRQRQMSGTNKGRFTVWYFYGTLTKDEVAAIDQVEHVSGFDIGKDTKEVYAIVTLINDSVVRAAINPLDSGSFPYHAMPWQERDGHWAGIGVPEQMRTPQRLTNAALRGLMNNAGKSADNQYVIDQRAIVPADNQWIVTPGKIWTTTNDFTGDIRQAFMAIQIPSTVEEMERIIVMGERFAEESTSIPLVTQGQSGATSPDTYGATKLQDNNANQLLRSIGYTFDDYITEPVVMMYYEWLLMDPDVPEQEKGEFEIDAHGSVAMVERAIQNQTIAQIIQASLNPAYGADPKRAFTQWVRSEKLDPKDFQYTDEEQQKMAQQPPPAPPPVQVAQINADTQLKLGLMKQQGDQLSLQHEQQIEAAANELESNRIQTEATVDLHKIVVQQQADMEDLKVQLAKVTMQLQTERELNSANNAHDARKHFNPQPRPAVQVPGRARNGQAASQVTQ